MARGRWKNRVRHEEERGREGERRGGGGEGYKELVEEEDGQDGGGDVLQTDGSNSPLPDK